MNRDQALAAWANPSPADCAALALLLQDDATLRDELLADRQIDGLLQLAANRSRGADQFVNCVLERIPARQSELGDVVPPPIAPPPVSVPVPLPPRLVFPRRGSGTTDRFHFSPVLVLTGLAMLLVGVVAGYLFQWSLSTRTSHPEVPIARLSPPSRDRINPPVDHLATLDPITDAVWVSSDTCLPLPAKAPLAPGKYELLRGQSKMRLAGGTDWLVEGPASLELVDPHLVRLSHGEIHSAPSRAGGFCVVSTPTGQVVDDGADFHLLVNDTGGTRLEIDRGRLWLDPRTPELAGFDKSTLGARGKPIMVSMTPDGLREAVLTSRGPASLLGEVSGADGKFVGIIAEGGKALECRSREVFEKLVVSIEKRAAAAPEEFLAEWTRLVEQLGGKLEIDFKLPADIPLPVPMPLPVPELPPGEVTSSFQGSIMVNGELKTFTSREEFDKAAGEMLKPLADFGLDLKLGELPGALNPEELKP